MKNMVVNIATKYRRKYERINEKIDYQKNEHYPKNLLDEGKLNKKNHQFHLRTFVSNLTHDELVYLLYAKITKKLSFKHIFQNNLKHLKTTSNTSKQN